MHATPEVAEEEIDLQTNDASAETRLRGQLLCAAGSQEAAEQIAKQYGITLVSYSWGVAEYWTEDDPQDVIAKGLEHGWTELSINGVSGLS